MTNGGWGGNQELFAQWTLEKEDPNSSKIIGIYKLRIYSFNIIYHQLC